jgi:signal transduction histidine kinase
VGFDPSAVPPATAGLRNIRERAAIFGGAAHIDSRPGHGATIRLELPLPE